MDKKIVEYDVDIKPTKLIKPLGLEMLLTNSNYEALGISILFNHATCTTS